MKYVYLLQSLSVPTQRYVGVTTDLKERLRAHNGGASLHTSKYRPWKVVTYLRFQDVVYSEAFRSETEALTRERQLKRWSHEKKEALIEGNLQRLKSLSRQRS